MKYADKLKDPRWQKKRLKIMERDNWTCRGCGRDDNQLQVHHLRYSNEPWEIGDDDLITFCHECHESAEASISSIKDGLVKTQRISGVTGLDEIDRIITELVALEPKDLMGVRKMVCARPDYSVLVKLFRHG